MFNFATKPFQKYSLWLVSLIMICAGMAAHGQDTGKEPISFIGHGAMFDQNGQEVAPTAAFIRGAQTWYRNYLVEKLTKAQRAQFDNLEGRLTANLALDEQSQLVLSANLLDWLIKTVNPEDSGRIQGKNNLMKLLLKTKLPEKPDINLPRSSEPFRINPELDKRLKTEIKSEVKGGGVVSLSTGTGGQAYRDLCSQANGVPIPPDIGTGGWVSRGQIPQSQLFIVAGLKAEVMTFQSTSPVGMCVALPRFDTNNQVQLDGVICLGKTSSKACFWDNEKNGITNVFTKGTVVPFANFGGGTEISAVNGGTGGVCTDCHAGENPYIIHDAILNSLAGLGLPTFPNNWDDPIVPTDTPPWPENPGPMKAPPVPAACAICHVQGSAGRFPHLSTALPGYCGAVLRTSVGALPLNQLNPPPTMPPGNPGGSVCTPNLPSSDPRFRACTATMTASCNPIGSTLTPSDPLYLQCAPELSTFLSWCGVPSNGTTSDRGDPHLTTFNGVSYDFQSAGEFVSLRHADGTEIQTRQTPVATASIFGPNPQTGLTSCVSVNTAVAARVGKFRVTYQPNLKGEADPNGLQLRVNGTLTTLRAKGLNLKGGGRIVKSAVGSGIEIFFPDKTHLIAVPNFWGPPNNTWYLNVDVVNTPAREGVMGAILPGTWLPTLPDGTTLGPIPGNLHQRFVDLNQKFADAWRVSDSTSLFDYARRTSTATFTNPSWPPENPPCIIPESKIPPARPIEPGKAQELCSQIVDKDMKSQCVFDVMVTGEAGFARAYLITQQLKSPPTRTGVKK
jgi:hypothetical protein